MKELPNRIRELRNARGWTLEQLGDRIHCSTTFLSNLERGERELSQYWMQKVAKVFKVEPADILSARDNSRSLSAEEHELVTLFQHGDDAQRRQLLQMARILIGAPAAKSKAA